jgi:hypothetical protein
MIGNDQSFILYPSGPEKIVQKLKDRTNETIRRKVALTADGGIPSNGL